MIGIAILLVAIAVLLWYWSSKSVRALNAIGSHVRYLCTTATAIQHNADLANAAVNNALAELRALRVDVRRSGDIAAVSNGPAVDVDMSRGRLPVRVHATDPAGSIVDKVTVDGQEIKDAFYADEIEGRVGFYDSSQTGGHGMGISSEARGYVQVHFRGHD